ncbi:hypothetical protein [Jannaschia sp. LMIT008]|uniref:tetratricopeptide repeat protein n=1 Tax=Jannaschia maritima TaxID=3032585 RepID=UPI002811DF52|nr:hypothetical protein [Jannaschia sp. LMIT008]
MQVQTAPPAAEDRRAAVARILATPAGRRVTRTGELLRYLVEAQIEGREVTPYAVAFDVFERDTDFDPGSDPIVRVQMGRLREFLRRQADDAPAGTWVPLLEPRSYSPEWRHAGTGRPGAAEGVAPPRPAEGARARWPLRAGVAAMVVLAVVASALLLRPAAAPVPVAVAEPALADAPVLAVLPFTTFNLDPQDEYLGPGMQQQLGVDLWRFGTVRVLLVDDATDLATTPGGTIHASSGTPVDYLLSGAVVGVPGGVTVRARVDNVARGLRVWQTAKMELGEDGGYARVVDRVARTIATGLGQPLGPIGQDVIQAIDDRHDDQPRDAYLCTLAYAAWERQGANAEFERVRECLAALAERGIETTATLSARAWMLALSVDPSRLLYDPDDPDGHIAEALDLARKAVRLDPTDAVAQERLGLVLWVAGEEEQAIEAFRRTVTLNPAQPRHRADLGLFLCLRDQCNEGYPYASEALELAIDPPTWYRTTPVIHDLLKGDWQAALQGARRLIRSTDDNNCGYYAAAAGHAGERPIDPRCVAVLRDTAAKRGDALAGLRFWVRGDELMDVLDDGVAKVGF